VGTKGQDGHNGPDMVPNRCTNSTSVTPIHSVGVISSRAAALQAHDEAPHLLMPAWAPF
jgi:hypothetical protein